MVTAKDVMSKDIVQVERGATISQAASIMMQRHVGSVIITAANYPVGILTETDITKTIAAGKDPHTTAVEDEMSSPLFSTAPENDLIQIINTMTNNHIKKMPVIEHQQVTGMITQTDIIKHALEVCTSLQGPKTDKIASYPDQLLRLVKSMDLTREWHMRCTSCGQQFLNEERNGVLVLQACPKCHGQMEYDLTPP